MVGALCALGGCRKVADYSVSDSTRPDPASPTPATEQPPSDPASLSPVDDVTQQDPLPPLERPTAPPDEQTAPAGPDSAPPENAPPEGTPPESAPPAQDLPDLDELFGTPAENDSQTGASSDQNEKSQDRAASPGERNANADAATNPFVDDPLPAQSGAGEAAPAPEPAAPSLWSSDESDNGDDGFDELFSGVAPDETSEASEAPVTPARPERVAEQTPPEPPRGDPPANPNTALPALPELTRDQPAEPDAPAPSDTPELQWAEAFPEEQQADESANAPQKAPPRDAPTLALDIDNTRRLAWLLGARYSLAVVAPPGGGDAQSDWTPAALAEMLGVDPPPPPGGAEGDEAIALVIKSARTLGDELADRRGRDHAALVEIALKTNALAAVYDRRPELAAPVARAVEAAAPHTGLDPAVWRDFLELLKSDPTPDQVRRSVFSLHGAVEQALRKSP